MPGFYREITAVISDTQFEYSRSREPPNRQNARVEASLEISDKKQLMEFLTNIRRVNGVYSVERIYRS